MLQDLVRAASAGPPTDSSAVPQSVVLTADRARLRVIWTEHDTVEISARRLRAACRCAWCTRSRHDGTFAAPFADVTIARIAPVGGYAINIAFDDDHARGIYPWVFLRTLARDDGQQP